MTLKDWKKNKEKNRFEKLGEIVGVGGYIIGKGTKEEKRVYWVVHGNKITHNFKTKSQAIKFAKSYMRTH